MESRIDQARLELVLERLLIAMDQGRHPYDRFALPQDHDIMGKSFPFGTREHAFWLFCLCFYMRGGIPSVDAAKRLASLRRQRPNLFIAEKAARMDPESITRSLESVHLNYMKLRLPPNWIDNSRRMSVDWDGDPRKLLAGVSDYQEAYRRIQNDKKGGGFWGFQEKMASMLLYFLMDQELIEFFLFPPPVDFHVLRVSANTGIIQVKPGDYGEDILSKQLLAEMRAALFNYCRDHEVSPIMVANAMWLLSSVLCKRNPGNRVIQGDYEARSTYLEPHEPRWTDVEIGNYLLSCGICPVQDLCKFNIGSAYYIRRGHLVVMRKRLKPPYRVARKHSEFVGAAAC